MEKENNDKFIVYKTFDNAVSANIVKGLLDSYGIHCFVANENIIWGYSFYNENMGGVQLHVLASDVEKANAILQAENETLENS